MICWRVLTKKVVQLISTYIGDFLPTTEDSNGYRPTNSQNMNQPIKIGGWRPKRQGPALVCHFQHTYPMVSGTAVPILTHPLFILFTANFWWAKQYLPHLRNKPFEVSGTRHIFGMFHHHTVGVDTSGRSTSKQGDVPMTKPDKGFPPCLVGTVRQGLFSKLLSFFRDQFGWCLALS